MTAIRTGARGSLRGGAGVVAAAAVVALAISVIGPTWLADGLAAAMLIGMHLAVGAVLIAGFARSAPA